VAPARRTMSSCRDAAEMQGAGLAHVVATGGVSGGCTTGWLATREAAWEGFYTVEAHGHAVELRKFPGGGWDGRLYGSIRGRWADDGYVPTTLARRPAWTHRDDGEHLACVQPCPMQAHPRAGPRCRYRSGYGVCLAIASCCRVDEEAAGAVWSPGCMLHPGGCRAQDAAWSSIW
jgi:hypothetical protein